MWWSPRKRPLWLRIWSFLLGGSWVWSDIWYFKCSLSWIVSQSRIFSFLCINMSKFNKFCWSTIAVAEAEKDLCSPNPCGPNALCNNGVCTCIAEYHGDPYINCRPECTINDECPQNKACLRNKCVDPCPGTCGTLAVCETHNHIAICTCPQGMTGNPFTYCRPFECKILLQLCLNMMNSSIFRN